MLLELYSITDDKKSSEKKTVKFFLNPADYLLPQEITDEKIKKITVCASFTLWKKRADFEMKEFQGQWILKKNYDQVCAPGNSGFPEFNFLIDYEDTEEKTFCLTGKTPLSEKVLSSGLQPCREVFGYNFLILLAEEKSCLLQIKDSEKFLDNVLKLSDYDLKNPADRERISNVRKVPATSRLWRGYHPYKKSRPQFESENTRIKLVNKALKENRIKSIITLCGDEEIDRANKEKISRYVKNIRKKKNQLFIDTSYETVYFEPGSLEWKETVKKIADFIISHPAPFYIHCRLGSDRTGTMSSILACICGADWEEIISDYEKTSKAGFGEFRSPRLLEYSWKKLLGFPPAGCGNLQKALCDFLTGNNVLTEDEISSLQKKLV